jgi:hypothetical protein
LIQDGYLGDFIKRSFIDQVMSHSRSPRFQPSGNRNAVEPECRKGTQRVIKSIAGGSAGGGHTSSTRKHHLRIVLNISSTDVSSSSFKESPEISFSTEDFRGEDANQDDPMVISISMVNCTVKRVLFD